MPVIEQLVPNTWSLTRIHEELMLYLDWSVVALELNKFVIWWFLLKFADSSSFFA